MSDCYTQEEIAKEVNLDKASVSRFVKKIAIWQNCRNATKSPTIIWLISRYRFITFGSLRKKFLGKVI